MKIPPLFKTLKTAAQEWSNDKVPTLGAALAYYTIFSMAPLVVISIAVAGFVFGRAAAAEGIVSTMQDLVGKSGADAVQAMIANAQSPASGTVATIVGLATLIFGASSVFAQLQDTLNAIWKVEAKSSTIRQMIRQRLFSFGLVLGVGFLLLVSLIATAALSAMGKFMSEKLPGGAALWHVFNIAISFSVVSILIGVIFKVIPDVKLRWRDVMRGAVLTAALFEVGKYGIGLYIGNGAIGSVYGAAGSLIVMLLWVYYSAQIIFFGAEFTKVDAITRGRVVAPEDHAKLRDQAPPGEDARSEIDRTLVGRLRTRIRERRVARDRARPPTRPLPGGHAEGV